MISAICLITAVVGDTMCSIPEATTLTPGIIAVTSSIDMSLGRAAIGLPDAEVDDVEVGQVLVLVREAEGWSVEQTIDLPEPYADARFGASVAIDDDVLVVGAPGDLDTGRAHVFEFVDGVWTSVAAIEADVPIALAEFGSAVDVAGDIIAVGSIFDGTTGAVHLYSVDGDTIEHEVRFGGVDDWGRLGHSIVTDGTTVFAGAPFSGTGGEVRAYTFDGEWIEAAPLVPETPIAGAVFGASLDLDGDRLAIGADQDSEAAAGAGAAYVFERVGDAWQQMRKLTSGEPATTGRFGRDVSIDGDGLVVGESLARRAWLFALDDPSTVIELVRTDSAVNGYIVGLDDGAALVALGNLIFEFCIDIGLCHDCNGNGVADRCDIATGVSVDCDRNLTPDECDVAEPGADCDEDGEPDVCALRGERAPYALADPAFATSIDADDERLIVGAPALERAFVAAWDDRLGWVTEGFLPAGDSYWPAHAVAIDGDVAVVSARYEDIDDVGNAGAVYVYRFSGAAWLFEARLTAPIPEQSAEFGTSLGVSGGWLLVGAPGADDHGLNSGAVYAFRFDGSAWVMSQSVAPPLIEAQDNFGASIDVDGASAVIGSRNADGAEGHGVVDVFRRIAGAWVDEARLEAPTPIFTQLGNSSAIDGDVVVAGAQGQLMAAVWRRTDDVWSEATVLTPPDPDVNGSFGFDVDVDGNTLAVTAEGGFFGDGAIVTYRWVDDSWAHQATLRDTRDDVNTAYFSRVVALQGTRLLGLNAGAVLTFDGLGLDCNANGVLDDCDVASGTSLDWNGNGVPDECEGIAAGDVNADGVVDAIDLLIILDAWGDCGGGACPDMNGDGVVDVVELITVLSQWS